MLDVVILGGGLAGLAAAWRLAEAGFEVAVLEKAAALGGLAGSFTRHGRPYPLGYHQIVEGDTPLLNTMTELGLRDAIRWRRVKMAFSVDDRLHTLSGPRDALRFPLSLRTKAGLARLITQTYLKGDDPSLANLDAETWIRRYAGEDACRTFFDRLTQLKFGLPCQDLSAAWLRERLLGREGRGRFGYLPHTDWTFALVKALATRLDELGVQLHLTAPAVKLKVATGRISEVQAQGLAPLRSKAVISTLPPPLLLALVPSLRSSPLADINYSGVVSTVIATRQQIPLPHYWTNFLRPFYRFGGIFRLDLLNPTLGQPDERILNFATHVGRRGEGNLLGQPQGRVLDGYLADFKKRFGLQLEPSWAHTSQIRFYSPIFYKDYQNPPIAAPGLKNLYLAGNFRTCPTLASTGTAIASGQQTARFVMQQLRQTTSGSKKASSHALGR